MRWVDHHCHFPDDDADVERWLQDADAAGIAAMVDVGCDVAGSAAAVERARRYRGVWATAGVHPHDASGGIDGLEALLDDEVVVAVGECGLDYHYLRSPAAAQRQVFADQIALAHRHRLPLVIHTREAWNDTFDVLAAEGVPERTVFHCFTGGPDEARRCLDIGALLSFSGIVTFPSAPELREAARVVPLERMLVETDAPFLTPVPHRGRPNAPLHVALVGAAIAELRGVPVEDVAAATTSSAERFYGLALGERPD